MDEESIKLGGGIELTGFNSLNGGDMVIVKKMVGNYVRKLEGMCKDFQGLRLRLKPLHKTEDKVKKFELQGQVIDGGQIYPAGIVEHNVFVGVDAVCKKLLSEMGG